MAEEIEGVQTISAQDIEANVIQRASRILGDEGGGNDVHIDPLNYSREVIQRVMASLKERRDRLQRTTGRTENPILTKLNLKYQMLRQLAAGKTVSVPQGSVSLFMTSGSEWLHSKGYYTKPAGSRCCSRFGCIACYCCGGVITC